jgi:hypothetical protein
MGSENSFSEMTDVIQTNLCVGATACDNEVVNINQEQISGPSCL